MLNSIRFALLYNNSGQCQHWLQFKTQQIGIAIFTWLLKGELIINFCFEPIETTAALCETSAVDEPNKKNQQKYSSSKRQRRVVVTGRNGKESQSFEITKPLYVYFLNYFFSLILFRMIIYKLKS